MSILTEGIPLGIANFVTIFGATILWLLTFWIPYLNVGTTIALNTMPIALADNEAPEGPTYIFKDKYRKYMGEYFVLMGLMYMAIWMASVFPSSLASSSPLPGHRPSTCSSTSISPRWMP